MYLFQLNQFQMFRALQTHIFSSLCCNCRNESEWWLHFSLTLWPFSPALMLSIFGRNIYSEFYCPAYVKPARDVYLVHLGVWGFWMEHLKIKKPLVRPAICRAAVSDILYFIRRCGDRPDPARNGKGQLQSQREFVAAAATDSFPQQILFKLISECARVPYFLIERDHKPFFPQKYLLPSVILKHQFSALPTRAKTWLSKKAVRGYLFHHSQRINKVHVTTNGSLTHVWHTTTFLAPFSLSNLAQGHKQKI